MPALATAPATRRPDPNVCRPWLAGRPRPAEAAWRRSARGALSREAGLRAEDDALARYERRGCRLLARNWRAPRTCGGGEIDLILERGPLTVFVEVKVRATLDDAAVAIRPAQARRLAAAIEVWMGEQGRTGDLRMDLAMFDRAGRFGVIPDALRDMDL